MRRACGTSLLPGRGRTETQVVRIGVYRVALRNRGLVRRLRPGRYVIEVRAGRSAATLGAVSRGVFRVTR